MSRGRTGEAIEQFRQAVALKPDFAVARVDLGNALAESGRLDAAIEQYRQALAIKPDYSAARQNLDIAVARRDLAAAAIARARAAVAAGRDNVDATAALARLLATCPAESLRNGAEAMALAKRANEICGGSRADVLDALAAAYAENGQFAEAVATARTALALASQGKPGGLADELRARLRMYEAHRPWRQTVGSSEAPPQAP